MSRITKYLRVFSMIVVLTTTVGFAQISGHRDWQKLPQGCRSCHVGHGVSGTAMLPLAEENFCYQCHGDQSEFQAVAQKHRIQPNLRMKNLRSEFNKPHRHPVELKSDNDLKALSKEGSIFGVNRAECMDCHRGHGVAQMAHTQGVTPKRSTASEREYEYQMCYKCHAVIIQSSMSKKDIKMWFDTGNPSYHPVEAIGKNNDVPSLKKPYSTAAIISCTDCHNNDDPSGPRGPHGSEYEYILERNYNRQDHVVEGRFEYALCYKCHNRDSILKDESFPLHKRHIADNKASCFTCHNSHGSRLNSHLIRFGEDTDPMVVQPSSSGRLEFFDLGRLSGQCYLTCHGVDHNPKVYQNRRH